MRLAPEFDLATISKGTHQRASIAMIIPTLGMVPAKFLGAFCRMAAPINGMCEQYIIEGLEVGEARDEGLAMCLKSATQPEYAFFVGDDMLPTWDATIELHKEMERGQWDMLTGLYYKKQEPAEPLIYRHDVVGPLKVDVHFKLGEVVPVDLTGMDFTMIRLKTLIGMERPYCKSGPSKVQPKFGETQDRIIAHTEDLYFIKKLQAHVQATRNEAARIGVHTGIRVGHYDVKSGFTY